MTATLVERLGFGFVVILMALGAFIYGIEDWRRQRRERKAARKAARGHHPSTRMRGPIPPDGEPLSDEEQKAFIGCIFASHIKIPDVTYNDDRRQP